MSARLLCRLALALAVAWLAAASVAEGQVDAIANDGVVLRGGSGRPITLVVRDAPIAEVFEMLSRHEEINILLSSEVEGEVSVNLFEESLDGTIRLIAEAAGYIAERRGRGYLIVDRDEAGKDSARGNTVIRTFKVHYSDPEIVSEILEEHTSRYGVVTVLPERRFVVVQDLPDFVSRIEELLVEVDRAPNQIFIEAKILEVSLDESQSFGIDWQQTFEAFDGEGTIGVEGLVPGTGTPGLFFDFFSSDTEVMLKALAEDGKVRTLATPTLLALEDEEAEVVIGDRLGYNVVTTINEVTSESVEFLESGVILRITASVDRDDTILLEVHPEVSTGVIVDGLPNQTTTEVTTKLLAQDGQAVFLAGLIKDRTTDNEEGIPVFKDIPYLGRLFQRREYFSLRSETVVVITAHLSEESRREAAEDKIRWFPEAERALEENRVELEEEVVPPGAIEPPWMGPFRGN